MDLIRVSDFHSVNRKSKIKNPKFAVLVGALLLALSFPAEAQQSMKVPHVGLLNYSSLSAMSKRIEIFREGLRERGYQEGKTIIIDDRHADGNLVRLPALAAQLVDLKVDLLVALGTPAITAAKNISTTIPIVMIAGDPVAVGLVDSLGRPGGNITGISDLTHDLSSKRLELLKETLPKLSRVAVLWNPDGPGSTLGWKKSQIASRELDLQVHSMAVRSPNAFAGAFEQATKMRSDALMLTGNPMFDANRRRITELAMKHRLPAIYEVRESVDVGGLMSYAPNSDELYRRTAYFVYRILKGAKPSDLPVEQPTKFELVINLKTAKTLGLRIPSKVLMWADKVIE